MELQDFLRIFLPLQWVELKIVLLNFGALLDLQFIINLLYLLYLFD